MFLKECRKEKFYKLVGHHYMANDDLRDIKIKLQKRKDFYDNMNDPSYFLKNPILVNHIFLVLEAEKHYDDWLTLKIIHKDQIGYLDFSNYSTLAKYVVEEIK